ncbi:kinase-like domain-containing protein [Mycena rebaudengoi]|nr:kinase-like domain-containing protein [Mycena rebaudengoi]
MEGAHAREGHAKFRYNAEVQLTIGQSIQPSLQPRIPLQEYSSISFCDIKSLFSFLEFTSSTVDPGMASILRGYSESMSANDSISALVKSRESRTILLKLSSDLGVADDPKLREALSKDERRLVAYILSILESNSSKESVLKLEGDPAQYFLDVVQNALDRGLLLEKDHNSKARKIIRKLSEACDKLPSSLFITGVTGRQEHATFGGGFGDIYQASYTGKTVALKHIRTFHRDAELRQIRLNFCREALVWQHLQHPYILPLIGIDRESFPASLCMVSPWMEHGTILKYLNDHGRANVDRLLSEIAQGLQYLHSRDIVHGDLRGVNILINNEWSACLADFGLTSLSDATTTTHTSIRAGSVRWMAPELLDPDRFGHQQFSRTPASDIYAFGCVCLELYTGRPPFADISETAAMFRVIDGERPLKPSCDPPISEALWQYMNEYWTENSTMRPAAHVVVQHIGLNYMKKSAPFNCQLPLKPLSIPLATTPEPNIAPSPPPADTSLFLPSSVDPHAGKVASPQFEPLSSLLEEEWIQPTSMKLALGRCSAWHYESVPSPQLKY